MATRPGATEQLREAHQRVVGELAALDRPREPCPHRLENVREHLAIVEFGERRESAVPR